MAFRESKIFWLIGLLLVKASFLAAGQVWVVSANQSPLQSIAPEILEAAYLGKPYQVSSGLTISPIDRVEAPGNVRGEFYSAVVKKSNTQLKAYWSAAIFTGRGYPPPSAQDIGEAKKMLMANPLAVTFIDPSEMESWMKVLLKVELSVK